MDKDLGTFRDLVLWLWDNHERPWEYSRRDALSIYQDIGGVYTSVLRKEELANILPSDDCVKTTFATMYLYLDPVTKGTTMVPVLSACCDFGRSPAEVRLRLGLFMRHKRNVKAIGYRFEAPEGKGSHNYYHVQVISGLKEPFSPQECSSWLPDRQPAFPLDADDPVKLLLCLLVSLYGVQYVARLKTDAYLGNRLSDYLDRLSCFHPKPFNWYWKVESEDPNKRPGYHGFADKTPEEVTKGLEDLKKKYPGNSISGITKGMWDSLPDVHKEVH